MKNNATKNLIQSLEDKYSAINQDKNVYLEGLLHSKTINYWDYIHTDALLNLQIQRTTLPDEMVFIGYHQINELIFKMILWELQQLAEMPVLNVDIFTDKLMRVSRYFDMLTSSFAIMQDGMDLAQYNKFRHTLTPASGFQSAQYRKIEFASTELINLIDPRFRETIDRDTAFEHAFEHLYWQAAGKDFKTGKKSILLTNFETRYKEEFITFMKVYNTKNLWTRYKELSVDDQKNNTLVNAMRHYDYTVNITWVMAHFNAAKHYILASSGDGEATGGSNWQKYMHPKYQKRIFFPELWSAKEKDNWGHEV
ncbi:tryptophan 2,3-dioxygenase [Formosa sp. Hel3_A1_48]|jgi:tryptophan 2,3-dioxygenase|uniref:tryptophan 2,3-dioxygenase family protein n=1 Tax=Formosa sp. Hel3_A1_48 TaxID=1336795 RepID=UPI00084E1A92|nr:tryptophan 2,3-dioxygenase family protein [Formosa sp. Hel3_A1_48]MDA9760794.1 tryptophan 2,3-dioxygenase family protein [Flavobacteriaceae bacterium]AOR26568.1 tryptophan 2,3-dioxygenase [Formosa sp. Hel3_A1_48]MDA9846556.1 tryptophan 2,3-dioxygenase family protein [Flavobacteriaceae bacterium]MDC0950879.1 tryptophan 2,3-dioxygenase family protein [Flavobacteriaceae bacterium]MDG1673672.1 tryptophan 2,3-dioxygenase family protein [Flavobacteriaceae bacterium]